MLLKGFFYRDRRVKWIFSGYFVGITLGRFVFFFCKCGGGEGEVVEFDVVVFIFFFKCSFTL